MSPLWLDAHASYIDKNRSTTAELITFNPGSLNNTALLKVPLASAGVLEDGSPLTVEITVANDVSIGESFDSDITYGVSDGTNFIGFETVEQWNYRNHSPCYGIEGKSGPTFHRTKRIAYDDPKPEFSYPDKFVFTIKLQRLWGSCVTTHGDGFNNKTAEYSRKSRPVPVPSQGLTLEVYKSDAPERVGIKYIKVTIRKTE